jgi:hypothetical protein
MPEKKQDTIKPSPTNPPVRRDEGDVFKETKERDRSLGKERERDPITRSEPREGSREEQDRSRRNQ